MVNNLFLSVGNYGIFLDLGLEVSPAHEAIIGG